MAHSQKVINSGKTRAELFCFESRSDVKEFHLMLHVCEPLLSFSEQLQALREAFQSIVCEQASNAVAVMKRYFVSDAANQTAAIEEMENDSCPVSIIQQSPLNGTKVALWAYLLTGVKAEKVASNAFAYETAGARHLWTAALSNEDKGAEAQTAKNFENYIGLLRQENLSLSENCLRTWLFVNDIDNHYAGAVKARNDVFDQNALTVDTHFIASTGIGGRQAHHRVLSQMDAYAVGGISPEQVHYLYATDHLNRTSDYGVRFERGTYVDFADRRQVFISGTASIDHRGEILHRGDIIRQTKRMWENVEALLAEADCGFDDVAQMIVYLRDMGDYANVQRLFAERFPDKPIMIVHASVCRPGWLIEMECMAVKEI